MKTPYKCNPAPNGNGNGKRRPGRPPGGKNPPGHRAGRKPNDGHKVELGASHKAEFPNGINLKRGTTPIPLDPALLPENEWEMYRPHLDGLEEGELRFVMEYMVDMNATNSAKRLGFSETGAHNIGSLILNRPHVRRAVDALLEVRARNSVLVANRLLIGLDELAHFDVGETQNPDGTYKPMSEWPAHARQALTGLEIQEIWMGQGEDRVQIGTVKKARFIDPLRARELLGRHLKLWGEPQVNIQNNTQYNVDMDVQLDLSKLSPQEIAHLEHYLAKAGAGREVLDLLPLPEGLGAGGL